MANASRNPARTVIEIQRLESKPESIEDAVRATRELWQILRRKQGCVVHHLYRSVAEPARWLAYSEWTSLPELGGARKELARSPLYRRQHSALKSASERAYEPFGAIHTLKGNGAEATVLVIAVDPSPESPEEAMAFLKDLPGYRAHVLMRKVGDENEVACVASFTSADDARAAAAAVAKQEPLLGYKHGVEMYRA